MSETPKTPQEAPNIDLASAAMTAVESDAASAAKTAENSGADGASGGHGDSASSAAPVPRANPLKKWVPMLKSGIGSFFAEIKAFIKLIVTAPLLVIKGDTMTRVLALGLMASLILISLTSVKLYKRFVVPLLPEFKHAAPHDDSAHDLEKELEIAQANLLYLESFTTTMKPNSARIKTVEIELYLECDQPETAAYLNKNIPRLREWVNNVLQGLDYDKMLTEDGKQTLRQLIAKALTHELKTRGHKGAVKRVFLTRFVMA